MPTALVIFNLRFVRIRYLLSNNKNRLHTKLSCQILCACARCKNGMVSNQRKTSMNETKRKRNARG